VTHQKINNQPGRSGEEIALDEEGAVGLKNSRKVRAYGWAETMFRGRGAGSGQEGETEGDWATDGTAFPNQALKNVGVMWAREKKRRGD